MGVIPMQLTLGTIIIAALLLTLRLPAAAEPAADDYAQQLREYDRRVQEQKELDSQRARTIWMPLAIIFGALFVYLIYSQIAARRRFQFLMNRSRIDVDRTLEQNQRMIELLESIDRKLDRPGQ